MPCKWLRRASGRSIRACGGDRERMNFERAYTARDLRKILARTHSETRVMMAAALPVETTRLELRCDDHRGRALIVHLRSVVYAYSPRLHKPRYEFMALWSSLN